MLQRSTHKVSRPIEAMFVVRWNVWWGWMIACKSRFVILDALESLGPSALSRLVALGLWDGETENTSTPVSLSCMVQTDTA
jgi:hypothetical protein